MRGIEKLGLIVIGAFLISINASADGNELLKQCMAAEKSMDDQATTDLFETGVCAGTVSAVRDTMAIMSANSNCIKVCFPKGSITNGQAVRVVTHYLKNNPAKLHENEIALVMYAYIAAYPCK